jgi:hypothetical protein
VSIDYEKRGLMACTVQRFAGRAGQLKFLDLDHPSSSARLLHGNRQSFAEAFRRMLNRQFPGWKIETLSAEMSLCQSFSPVYPRAILTRGGRQIAAMACVKETDEPGLLTFALLWHNHVCRRAPSRDATPLALFLPENTGNITALRLRWLNVRATLFRFNEDGLAGEVDTADLGNMETQIVRRMPVELSDEMQDFVGRLRSGFGVEALDDAEGSVTLRVAGLAFARITKGHLYCGLEGVQPFTVANAQEAELLASQLASVRRPGSTDCVHPIYRAHPERWLESCVRKNMKVIDAGLEDRPVLGQVITFAARDRNIIDLLSVGRDGRLIILELKVVEDIHLPLQALDYWMRAECHLKRGDLDLLFPDAQVSKLSPRLLMIAPSTRFHSGNEVILSYFDSRIETERVGLNLEWQQRLKVSFRLRGAEKPQSHGRLA